MQKSSTRPPTRGQLHQLSSLSVTHAALPAHDASFQKATPEKLDHPTSQQFTRERNTGTNDLPPQPTGVDDEPKRVSRENYDSEDSTEHLAKLVARDTFSGKDVSRLEHERIADFELQLSETLAERDRHITQLADQLAQTSALLEQAEANAAEAKKRAGLELRELQAKLDESLLSRDHALDQAQSALQKASRAAEINEQSQRELTEMRVELEARKSEFAALNLRLVDDCAKSKAEADTNRNQSPTGFVITDEDRVVYRLMERMRAMEAEIASFRWNEKSFEMMECRNEG